MTVAANSPNSNVQVAKNHSLGANSSISGLQLLLSNDGKTDDCCPPSRPISAASDSSESSTESSATSEDDEEQEVTFNTIKRRQTKINVITPKSVSSSPKNESNSMVASKPSTTSNAAINDTQETCDELKNIANSNGDRACNINDKSAVNDSKTGDVNDNKENGFNKKPRSSPDIAKINGDKSDIERTPSETTIDSVTKSDDKNIKKEPKTSKSANSMNSVVNSFDEQNSLPGINLPARFKKANSKTKKSTIRKSDLRNNGCGSSDSDKKVSK